MCANVQKYSPHLGDKHIQYVHFPLHKLETFTYMAVDTSPKGLLRMKQNVWHEKKKHPLKSVIPCMISWLPLPPKKCGTKLNHTSVKPNDVYNSTP